MKEFIVSQISNGWILQGPRHKEDVASLGIQAEIFLPTIFAVSDILQTWDINGFPKASSRANEKYPQVK